MPRNPGGAGPDFALPPTYHGSTLGNFRASDSDVLSQCRKIDHLVLQPSIATKRYMKVRELMKVVGVEGEREPCWTYLCFIELSWAEAAENPTQGSMRF